MEDHLLTSCPKLNYRRKTCGQNIQNFIPEWETLNNITVFRKRGQLSVEEEWFYNGEKLEAVNDFNYLGVVFNYTGSYTLNQQTLSGKGLKALKTYCYQNYARLNCNLKLLVNFLMPLFDRFYHMDVKPGDFLNLKKLSAYTLVL